MTPGDEIDTNRDSGARASPSRKWWVVAVAVAVVVAVLVSVWQWRLRSEMATIAQQRKETEHRLERLQKEFEKAKRAEAQLKKRLEQVRQRAKEQRSPPYFDSPGWRNDTGRPSGGRTRPLPADPSRRKPGEGELIP